MNFNHQNTTTGERISSLVCGAVGLSLVGWCVHDFVSIMSEGGSHLAIFAGALFAFAKGIGGVLFLAPSLARWALTPAFHLVDLIYSPGGYAKRPPLDYRLADSYRKERKFDLAIERYSEILRYYPKEAPAHAWLYVLLQHTASPCRARRVLRRARRKLRRPEQWQEFQSRVTQAGGGMEVTGAKRVVSLRQSC